MHSKRLHTLTLLLLVMVAFCLAGDFDIRLEGGGVWFSMNDARIPGDSGTMFDMIDLIGNGPNPYFRLYGTYNFDDRHALRLTLAPLKVSGTGRLSEDVTFMNDVFAADTPTEGVYKFNTYRLTYRWSFYNRKSWRWALGAAVLVRDAEISLEQGDKREYKDDLGLVPLLHMLGEYRVNDKTSVILDVEGAWAPMGRAVDATIMAQHSLTSGLYFAAGFRTLEGGSDVDEVYTFAWLHYLQAAVGFRF